MKSFILTLGILGTLTTLTACGESDETIPSYQIAPSDEKDLSNDLNNNETASDTSKDDTTSNVNTATDTSSSNTSDTNTNTNTEENAEKDTDKEEDAEEEATDTSPPVSDQPMQFTDIAFSSVGSGLCFAGDPDGDGHEFCVKEFKIEDGKLFQALPRKSDEDINFFELSTQRYSLVQSLPSGIPANLWNMKEGRFDDCSNIEDVDYIKIQLTHDGITKSWTMTKLPCEEDLQPFASEVNKAIKHINDHPDFTSTVIGKDQGGLCQEIRDFYCSETLKIENNKLYEDTLHSNYKRLETNFVELSEDKYNRVELVPFKVPLELWEMPEGNIGECSYTKTVNGRVVHTDVMDVGNTYVQLTRDGITKAWYLTGKPCKLADNLQEFVDTIYDSFEAVDSE